MIATRSVRLLGYFEQSPYVSGIRRCGEVARMAAFSDISCEVAHWRWNLARFAQLRCWWVCHVLLLCSSWEAANPCLQVALNILQFDAASSPHCFSPMTSRMRLNWFN